MNCVPARDRTRTREIARARRDKGGGGMGGLSPVYQHTNTMFTPLILGVGFGLVYQGIYEGNLSVTRDGYKCQRVNKGGKGRRGWGGHHKPISLIKYKIVV